MPVDEKMDEASTSTQAPNSNIATTVTSVQAMTQELQKLRMITNWYWCLNVLNVCVPNKSKK